MICSDCGGEIKGVKLDHEYDAYGPKNIILLDIPGFRCIKCGKETVDANIANDVVIFLRKIEAGLVNVSELNGVIIVKFPEN